MLWRLFGHSYGAVVLGDHHIDALLWDERGALPDTFSTVVLGDRAVSPTRIAPDHLVAKV